MYNVWKTLLRGLNGYSSDFPARILSGAEKECVQKSALEELKYLTGQDFGLDAGAWEAWLEAHPRVIQEREANGELPPLPPDRFDLE